MVEDLEVELLIELLAVLTGGGEQEFVGHIHEQAKIARGMFAESSDQCWTHQCRVTGGGAEMFDAFTKFFW